MSNQINDKNRTLLLKIARKTITKKSKQNILTPEEIENLDDILKKKRGCFVTLNKNNNLRGCIGYILPVEPLYKAVIDNAYSAAFSDPRFPPVSGNEVDDLHIDISVLTVPAKLDYKNKDDLLEKLKPLEDGVIVKGGFSCATFLPQVWEQLPDKEEFLGHLCMKAGLSPDAWKNGDLDIEIYNAEVFEEK
jgi:AmmeMemoRadiSam system protein A